MMSNMIDSEIEFRFRYDPGLAFSGWKKYRGMKRIVREVAVYVVILCLQLRVYGNRTSSGTVMARRLRTAKRGHRRPKAR